jgi:predicted esterase
MRLATSSVPADVLSKIIKRQINPKNADDRLKVVRFYLQAERYQDATAELNQIIDDFPGRAGLAAVAHDLKQMGARQIIKEIDTRRKAGQHQYAFHLLETFPTEGVDGDLLQQVRAKLDEYNELKKQGETTVDKLKELAGTLPAGVMQKRVQPIIKEITDELTVGTLDRMATYRRFADDAQSKPEAKLSLAISGWLVGAADATENLQVALSMAEMRDLVRDYLMQDVKLKRDEIELKIRSQEAAAPKLIAALADHMKPPVETDPQSDPGYYKLSIPGLQNETPVNYFVQLPPEYDPHARYPCVVTLHGAGTTAEQQVAWWAGDFIERNGQKIRSGQATRHGCIVVSPDWTVEHQKEFESTAREHDAVLSVLRDACRRFAIDTDRVFLSGHSAGGTAAWEIGLAHPDLWAGVIPIVPTLDKTVQLYWKNAERVPLYFVCGELDGDKFVKNAPEFDRYLGASKAGAFDCTIVEYRGRGHEHFSDEIQRLFDWMGRKQRNFFPREFLTYTQRPFDNYFWCVELRDFQPGPRPMEVEAKLTASNGVSVRAGGNVTVWLSPEMKIDFGRPVVVNLNGTQMASPSKIQPNIHVLLEDLRTRADRRHPFWAKVE